jgi:hypothetical protein
VSRPDAPRSDAPLPESSAPERALPEPASLPVARRLLEVARRVDPGEIGELWIFPPLPEVEASAEFLVFTRYASDGRLRLYTARDAGPARPASGGEPRSGPREPATGTAEPETAVGEEVRAHGAVPADRVPRLLERFQRRVGVDHDPVHVRLEGSQVRWRSLVRAAGPEEQGRETGTEAAGDVDGGVVNP